MDASDFKAGDRVRYDGGGHWTIPAGEYTVAGDELFYGDTGYLLDTYVPLDARHVCEFGMFGNGIYGVTPNVLTLVSAPVPTRDTWVIATPDEWNTRSRTTLVGTVAACCRWNDNPTHVKVVFGGEHDYYGTGSVTPTKFQPGDWVQDTSGMIHRVGTIRLLDGEPFFVFEDGVENYAGRGARADNLTTPNGTPKFDFGDKVVNTNGTVLTVSKIQKSYSPYRGAFYYYPGGFEKELFSQDEARASATYDVEVLRGKWSTLRMELDTIEREGKAARARLDALL